jgi:hypothetical protein
MTDFMNVKANSAMGFKVLMVSSFHTQQYAFQILETKVTSIGPFP